MPPPPSSGNAAAYLRTRVLTASPEQLRLLLLEGAVKFARQGRDGLASRDFEASYQGFSKCRNIILELMNSMRPEIDPELCNRLNGLYTFLFTLLIEAGHTKDVAAADKVIQLLDYERETWSMVVEKVAAEKAQATAARAAIASEPIADTPDARPSLSVQG